LPLGQAEHASVLPETANVPFSHGCFDVAPSLTGHFDPFGQSSQVAAVPAPSPDQKPAVQAAHVVCVLSYFPAGHAVHVVR